MSTTPSIQVIPMASARQAVEEEAAPRSFSSIVISETLAQTGARMGLVWVTLLVLGAVFGPFLASSFPLIAEVDGRWQSPLLRNLVPADVVLLTAFFTGLILLLMRSIAASARIGIFFWLVALVIPFSLWSVVARDYRWYASEFGKLLVYGGLGIAAVIDVAILIAMPFLIRLSRRQWVTLAVISAALAGLLILIPVRPPSVVVYEEYRDLATSGRMRHAVETPIPYSPMDRLRDQPRAQLQPPSSRHLLGTEINGADVLSRMIHASRVALAIGFIATGIAVFAGCIIGGVMGYFSGRVDIVGMRLIEIFEAIPTLFLLISFVAFFGRNLYFMMVIIGLTSWSGDARFIRAEFLRLRGQDFVQAAVAAGLPLRSILFRHMLPNGIAPVLVSASFGVASAILSESVLSFLGLGLVDEPSWGDLLSQATGQGGTFTWWLAVFPGAAIFLTVFSYNLIGEALRDAMDPKLRARE